MKTERIKEAPRPARDGGNGSGQGVHAADPKILDGVVELLKHTFHGQIVIITQNFRVVQVERKENFNPEELVHPGPGLLDDLSSPQQILKKIGGALEDLEFGQVILVVKKGHLVQIERLQKVRLPNVQGLGGDGI